MNDLPLIYIAGPYSSDPVGGTRRAIHHGMDLWQEGYAVPLIPHLSMLTDLVMEDRLGDASEWYAFDLHLLRRCDAFWRLDGASTGADAEADEAERLGLPMFLESDRDDLIDWCRAWVLDPVGQPG